MTTIVCTRAGMVADRRISSDVIFLSKKLFLINGSIYGICGDIEQAIKFLDWRRNPDQKPQFAEISDIEILELTPDARMLRWSSELVGVEIDNDYYAIGSGAQLALGALSMGATPQQAIRIASKWDTSTGTEIQTMKLKAK